MENPFTGGIDTILQKAAGAYLIFSLKFNSIREVLDGYMVHSRKFVEILAACSTWSL